MTGPALRPTVGVVLAAGPGRRMGGRKPLVDLHGESLVERSIHVLAGGGCDRVVVVTGADAEEVAAGSAALDVTTPLTIAHNADWATGQASSVRVGLEAVLAIGGHGALVMPVDLPDIGPAVVRRLLTAAAGAAQQVIAAAYAGHLRNPVVFPPEALGEVASALHGDVGARDWLDAHPERIVAVECSDIGQPNDLDTPEQVAEWLGRNP